MATQEAIDAVKAELPSNAASYGWDDTYIGAQLDAGLAGNALFLKYWQKVASETAEFVDMSESGSSRSLSQISKTAQAMAKMFQDALDEEEEEAPTARGIRSRAITRV